MNLDKILDPSTIFGKLVIGVLIGLIVHKLTKDDNKAKTNNIKIKDNKGMIFQDTKIEGDIDVKKHNKGKE